MLATTSFFCRSLFTGDSGHAPTNKAPGRRQAGSCLSLRGLLVVLALVAQLSALNISCRASELTDLGDGLSYLRVQSFDESAKDLSAAIREREFLIVDLRHAATTAESTGLLRAALGARTSKQPAFILVGPATPAAIGEALTSVTDHCLTLGVKESAPAPQVIIDQPAATARLAYEALDSGQPLASLITGKIAKERYDESALMKEFDGGNTNPVPPAGPDPTAKPAPEKSSATEPVAPGVSKVEPLIDRVLQRAVHLHRAMLAIKVRSS